MSNENLAREATLKIAIGHLLVIWDILANNVACSRFLDELTDEEKRAVLALQDLCENELTENEIKVKPLAEWEELMQQARDFIKTIPVEFLG